MYQCDHIFINVFKTVPPFNSVTQSRRNINYIRFYRPKHDNTDRCRTTGYEGICIGNQQTEESRLMSRWVNKHADTKKTTKTPSCVKTSNLGVITAEDHGTSYRLGHWDWAPAIYSTIKFPIGTISSRAVFCG